MTDEAGGAHPPLPVADEQSAAFWKAAAEHTLVLARCTHCGHRSHPPGVVCTRCLHPDARFEFAPVDGGGTVRSWIVIRDSFLPGFEVPFVLVDVELDVEPGLRMIGRLVDGVDAGVRLGDRVVTVFDDVAPGVAVPAFALEGPR
jgi:uncharacterized OB-fold protein